MTGPDVRARKTRDYRRAAHGGPAAGPWAIGERVQLHPATDDWMRGDRYGAVIGYGRPRVIVARAGEPAVTVRIVIIRTDSGRTVRHHPANVLESRS